MEATMSSKLPGHQTLATSCENLTISPDCLQILLSSSNSKTLEEALQSLVEASRTYQGRSHLASIKSLIPCLLSLVSHPLSPTSLTVKILRNLCAGEISNQTAFVELGGVNIVSAVLKNKLLELDVARFGTQLLGNVVLAGEMHQNVVWDGFFPEGFKEIARVQRSEVVDPLCMVLCTCCEGSGQRSEEICEDRGLQILVEILKTVSSVGFQEQWLPLLLMKLCFEGPHFCHLFLKLSSTKNSSDLNCLDAPFTLEQAFLLNLLSDTMNQRIEETKVSNDFAIAVLELLKNASKTVDSIPRGQSDLPVGSPSIDVLGYSLNILRDLCALGSLKEPSTITTGDSKLEVSLPVVDLLLELGLLNLLLHLLRELEPPAIIRKSGAQEGKQGKLCPYIGYRRDIVSVIGNCTFRRKKVQDDIRQQNGILLLMQQCVVDKDNPFLREWGIWAVRNLLEGNVDNQQEVAEMEIQGSVDSPEISGLGLRVEVDPKSRRAKLVNVS